jgi:hypothetical protein
MSMELRQALEQVARRFRHVRLWSSLAVCWLTWAVVGVGLTALLSGPGAASTSRGSLLTAFAAMATASALACIFLTLRSVRDRRWVARRIEARHPELGTGLLAAVEEDASVPDGKLGFLQSAVIRKALDHRRSTNWDDAVSPWRLWGSQVAHATALGCLLLVIATLIGQTRSRANGAGSTATGAGYEVQVDPGNTEIERGSTLLVVARFNGAVPADASLVVEDAAQGGARRGMTRSLEDPTFAGRVESVSADLSYRVEFEGQSSETFHVGVFEYPELERTDAKLVFPSYTSLEPKTVEDIRHVTAVEGTELTLLCRLNKDVAVARLVDEVDQVIDLTPPDAGAHVYRTNLTLTDPHRYKVHLVDKEGRSNKLPAEIVVNVTRNRPPTVVMTQPSRDVRVSPVEELKLKAKIEDDFGLVRHGVSFTVAGQDPREIALKGPAPTLRRVQAEHLLDFESLKAAPDQLVTYFFWAEDVGPDGQPRRTSGDMFFAEVRHFEEIFRQGEQPPSGSAANEDQEGGQNAEAAGKLAELQKEIINGTWKVIRRETRAKPSDKLADDGKLLKESQHSAIEQAAQLAEKLKDPASKASLEQATRFMKDAEKQLTLVAESSSIKALSPALVAEQGAYQALLKLRAREFEVIRNNSRQRQQGGRASAGSPSQSQLQQLELSNEENRYEEQSTAKAQQEKLTQREREQRETRQVLNRLKELAQRQNDLNERLKELQSALEAAKTAQAREEIEKQLKRLRDQQQQILRDTDELRERMEREENRERMADARQQIEQSREHVRQASEALEEGRVPQAVTESARAGRELNDLREEIRKGSSDRFTEEMTEMRGQARKLDEDQKKLTEQLDAWNARPQNSLRDTGERKQTREGLGQQGKQLDQLLDRMRRTVQDAEETEPLLAKELFDTVRKANEQKVADNLKVAEQLVDAGIAEEAATSTRRAGEGIEQLREGVERAAKNVLGDETAALRRAQGELEDLADQVNREIAQATGREPTDQDKDANPPSQQRPGRTGPQTKAQTPGQPGEQAQQGQQGGQQAQQKQQDQQGGQQAQQGQQAQGSLRGGNPSQRGQQQQRGGATGQGQGGPQAAGLDRILEGLATGPGGPITGEGFRQWSDRLRDVEELLENPEMRAEAARIRDRARGAREEFKRHAKEPDWKQMKDMVADPIKELRNRVAEEVRRRESPDALVPIDRDPVPPQFTEGVRRYYERLGSGR